MAGGINTFAYVGGNPVVRVDPYGLQSPAVCANPINFAQCVAAGELSSAQAAVIRMGIRMAARNAAGDLSQETSSDDPYGGYTQLEEDDALEIANNLTGEESCDLLEEAITTLKNRIRGRQQNLNDHFGGDAGHNNRVKKLKDALSALEGAKESGDCC